MRVRGYLRSLRIRIVLALASLALMSAVIYSVFAWFIFETSDDRLFNWQILSVNQHAVKVKKIPTESVNSFVVIGHENTLTQRLVHRYELPQAYTHAEVLADVFDVSQVSDYEGNHRIFDIEFDNPLLELQIVESPWQEARLYVVYDVSGFESASSPTNLYSDSFTLIVLLPIALVLALFVFLLSTGLTQAILKPLTRLSSQVTTVSIEHLSTPLTEHYYPDEVGELANTFNTFIAKIEKYIENEKRFSREVSHELRTPTTSLTIALDLFETTDLDERQQQLLARMKRANHDMTQLINTFIWLARNNPEHAPKEPVNIHQRVNALLDKLAYLSDNKPIKLSNNVDKEMTVIANPALLDIILNNLLRNALQYTLEGCIKIYASEHLLTIKDTGVGIPAGELKNIEQAFYSLQPDGIGLGLSIVQRIMLKLKWQLSIKSSPNQGTEVTINFLTE